MTSTDAVKVKPLTSIEDFLRRFEAVAGEFHKEHTESGQDRIRHKDTCCCPLEVLAGTNKPGITEACSMLHIGVLNKVAASVVCAADDYFPTYLTDEETTERKALRDKMLRMMRLAA